MIDPQHLICIVTGVQLVAELGDRPLAQRVEREVRRHLRARLGRRKKGQPPHLAPVIVSDVLYINSELLQQRPMISIGGPGVNAVAGALANELPAAVAIENSLLIQMDVEFEDLRCCVWGMSHLETVQAVELFIVKGYLANFLDAVVEWSFDDEP